MTDGTLRDGTRQAEYTTQLAEGSGSADGIATIERRRLVPKGDGSVMVVATVTDPVTKKKGRRFGEGDGAEFFRRA